MKTPLRQSSVTAAIIAGGKSIRFGTPKAYARFQNKTLLEYAIQIAEQISNRVIIVASDQHHYQEFGVPVFADLIPDCGPLGGVYTALFHSATPLVATLSCDLPLLPPQIYLILIRQQIGNRPVVALSNRGLEPLIAIWPKSLIQSVKDALLKRQFQLCRILSQVQAVEVLLPEVLPGYDERWFLNINTPDDLRKIEK